MSDGGLEQMLEDLKASFDEAFARPVELVTDAHEDVIIVRVGERGVAIRVSEITMLSKCPPLAKVPGRNAALSGLAGIRGALVAVYDLAVLMGGAATPVDGGWTVVCAAEPSAALRFDELVGYERVPSADLRSGASTSRDDGVRFVVSDDENHPVISVPGLWGRLNVTPAKNSQTQE